jgi:hypothetical protein
MMSAPIVRGPSGSGFLLIVLCAASFGQETSYETSLYSPSVYFSPRERIGIYMEGTYQPVVLPLDDVDYLDLGGGWLVTLGYSADAFDSPDGRLGLEVAFARSKHRHPSAGTTAAYQRFQMGLRWWETSHPRAMPYLATGISFHDINDAAGDVNGWGFYGGGGVTIAANEFISLGVDVRFHIWGGEDRFGAVTYGITPAVGLGLSATF